MRRPPETSDPWRSAREPQTRRSSHRSPPSGEWDVRFGTGSTDLEQWEFEVTSGGRVRYVVDDDQHAIWLIYESPRHPKDTDN